MPQLLVLDGTALAFRAFFAIRGLTDGDGRPSGALYGYMAAVLRALEDFPSDAVVVAWDRPEPTFRHQLSPDYKANRAELDEDLAMQFPWMREVTELLGIPQLDRPGYEADDILASLAVQSSAQGWKTLLFSNDKDLAQVVSEQILQCPPPKAGAAAEKMGPAEVEAKFGVRPEQMIDWQALVGDSSDNIAGVPGIGPKKATTLLQKYGDLEQVLQRGPQEEKGKLAENLATHAADARAARTMVTLVVDMELGDAGAFVVQARKQLELLAFCHQHGLRSLRERFESEAGTPAGGAAGASGAPTGRAAGRDYRTVDTPEMLAELRQGLEQSGGFAFDTETTDIDPLRARLVGMSFCWVAGTAWYVPLNLSDALRGPGGEDPVSFLAPVLQDATVPKTGQNLKYDLHVMRRHGVAIAGVGFDTMLAHFLVDPNSRHNLDELSLNYLGLRKIPTKELLGSGRNALTMDQVPVPTVSEYACEDADATWQLDRILRQELKGAGGDAERLMFELDLPLLPVLERMEAHGIRLDIERVRALDEILEQRQQAATAAVYAAAGEEFNLNSPKQLGPILFEKMLIQNEAGVKRVGRTKTGYRTDAATLDRYSGIAVVDHLLDYRRLTKLRSTYLEALPRWVNPETGRIHTSYNQAVASTGRLSSSDPNLQNIPIRSQEGREIRRAFVPREDGWILVSADYSQIELRLVAHMSADPALVAAFLEGADVHARTAALVFETGSEGVTAEMRGRAKAVNFGILYGMGAQRLGRQIGMSTADARAFIDAYFDALPGVRAWIDSTLAAAVDCGYTTTLMGRQRPIPGIQSRDGRVRANAENVAVNSPVQGSAADLIKLAMLRVDERLAASGLQAAMLLQVHDELVFECPAAELQPLSELVREAMESVMDLEVPLKVDIGCGNDWSEAH